ncbi:TonB-dependent receptor [Pseudohalioglobus lutimaris]|uniref:TonB-dependent receptor n=1 Tax=Pseudohalioglobus lutimaris TaxID=1737061 RepID=A0A2N5X946_9GAMM|nr:TonB-dependent receptor [Pseudohalioglobus lutimaris]PLW71024.1 TonB-dependent receptor [Pseudohalioglobus lutimaris]
MKPRTTLLAILALSAGGAGAHELEEVVVQGRSLVLIKQARSASEGVVGQEDLEIRPLLRAGDVLEAVPGMVVTQHSGSGKSNQMFLRGFNLDHGTDFATWVDGMPVNMRTHGHGQGYTDINFLIPETIRTIAFVKGPYHAELGDFSSAGGAHISTAEQSSGAEARLQLGENGYRRLLGMGGSDLGRGRLSVALEALAYDGPWTDIEEDVDKTNGLLRYYQGVEDSNWSVTLMGYDNNWNAADQIPERAVARGLIDEFGSLDKTLGGNSSRYSLSAALRRQSDAGGLQLSAYVIDYQMQLWSNFTYLLDDPQRGDQFEQLDDRRIYGASWNQHWFAQGNLKHSAGAELRHDDIDKVGLFRTQGRLRLDTTRLDAVEETSLGLYYEIDWAWNDQWRVVGGLRGDYYHFDVESDRAINSGSDADTIISPKASLIYTPSANREFYLSGGLGFHSNDARGTTIRVDPVSGDPVEAVDPLVRSRGAEVGLRNDWWGRANSSLALWYLELDSELLFVGDAGNTEASRPSRRWGVEWNNYWDVTEVWSLELDMAWTDARFDDRAPGGDFIPGAVEWVVSGALNAVYPGGWFGSLRLRQFGGAPLTEDGSVKADGSSLASLAIGWEGERLRLQLDTLNLFDSDDHDIDYFYASRLPSEPADGIEDTHYHAFEPRQLRLSVGWRL